MTTAVLKPTHNNPWVIWSVSVSFVLFQFFLQLSSGVLVKELINDFSLTAFGAGLLVSSYYYVYVLLQIPVGVLLDQWGCRLLLACGALICALGCLCFAQSYSLAYALTGRLMMGGGAAFAFVGLLHVIRDNFPLKRYAYLVGLAEAVGLVATILGTISLALILSRFGWRAMLTELAIAGSLIAVLCWYFLPKKSNDKPKNQFSKQELKRVMSDKVAWLNGLFIGLMFSVITVFAALWAPSFIQVKLSTNLTTATSIATLLFLGAAIGCPLFGHLSSQFQNRNTLMKASALLSTLLFLVLIYVPMTSKLFCGFITLSIGLSCSSYMLSFEISDQLAPQGLKNTYTGFTNTLAVLSAPLLQPLIGFALDSQSQNAHHDLAAFQTGVTIIPLCLLLAFVIVFFLPKQDSPRHKRRVCPQPQHQKIF